MSTITALKLRVYPNQAQMSLVETYFRARQWAYHLGVKINKDAWSLWCEMADAFPELKRDMPRPKWKNSGYLSKLISAKKQEIRVYNETHEEPHPESFILTVPRCIFTQALDDFQHCLNKAFKDRKEKTLPKSKMKGFPNFYSLYNRKTFRYQIDKPSTNQKHIETWFNGKIRLGDLVLRYKDPTKLPEKLPSLVTVSQNAYGQYFASFITKEPRTYKNPVQEQKRLKRQDALVFLKSLSLSEKRRLGYDPNLCAEFFYDSTGLSFSLAEPEFKKVLEAKLLKCAKHLSKTQQRNKKKNVKTSKRSLKAKQQLAKVYLDRANSKKDYQEKLTSLLALFYPEQAREHLDIKEMMEKNGKTQSRARKDRSYKKYKLSRNFSHVSMAVQRALMEQKLLRIHGEDHVLITLDKFERTTQCCSACKEERLTVKIGVKTWQCPYCQTLHIRDENAAKNVLDKGFNIDSRKANKKKPDKVNYILTFPDMELDPKKGWPVTRSVGLGVGKRYRFIKYEKIKEIFGEFETQLFNKLSLIGMLRVAVQKAS